MESTDTVKAPPVSIPATSAQSSQKVKKNKQQSAKSVPHRDIYARLSFLYQTAQSLSQSGELEAVGRMYSHTMKSIAKKSVLRV